jgi:hypothetical protein
MARHVQITILSGSIATIPIVRCPGSTCHGRLKQETWLPLISKEHSDRYETRCLKSLTISCAHCHNPTSFFVSGRSSQSAADEWRASLESDDDRALFTSNLDEFHRGEMDESLFLNLSIGFMRTAGARRALQLNGTRNKAPHLNVLFLSIADYALRARLQFHCLKR